MRASCFFVTITPFFARLITGCKIASIGKLPNFSCTAKTPATVPGTPIAMAPRVLFPWITFPFSSKNIFFVADKGAFSL